MRPLVLVAAVMMVACGGGEAPPPHPAAPPPAAAACPDKRPTGASDYLAALVALPAIGDASVYATKAPSNGVVVTFAIEERPTIAEVVYDGVHAFAKSELHPGPMQEGKPFDAAIVKMFVSAFTEAYKERGYGGANVAVASEPAGEGRVRVRVPVTEGAKWLRKDRLPRPQPRRRRRAAESGAARAGLDVRGRPARARRVARHGWYYDHGMLNARVEAQRGTPGPDGLVPITFTLQEGDVFTIRSVAIEGVSAAEQRTLLAEVTTKPKRTFSRAAADDDLRRVRVRVRAEKLHPRADVDVEPLTELDPKTKTVALRFEVSVREH